MKKRIVVVCPGRGTYAKDTLGYLRQHGTLVGAFLRDLDQRRSLNQEPTITELDFADKFDSEKHTRGENASALIYACAYADFMAIDRERFEIVAVTGNSMGWYLALAFGGSLDWPNAYHVINTMGSMMKNEIIGGQILYPVTDSEWRPSAERAGALRSALKRIREIPGAEVYPSIYLGGFVVLGANASAIQALRRELPRVESYPLELVNHAAFHTPLLREISKRGFAMIRADTLTKPTLPLIDGRGHIWSPWTTSREDLYQYTLGHQVIEPYDFTRAISVALKEFAPDHLVLLGPGSSLGGVTGQILVQNNWRGLVNKSDFIKRQAEDPLVLSLGRGDQRGLVSRSSPA